MKCGACGYEYEIEYDLNKPMPERIKIVKGDQDFITVVGGLVTRPPFHSSEFPREVNLYACPKCKTIRLSDD